MIELDPSSSALILIDLQKGIFGMQAAPYSCEQIFTRAADLSARFRAAGATVVRVRVEMGVNRAEMPPGLTDRVASLPPGGIPADYADFPDDPAAHGDLIVTKRQWGAFYGTDLDARLRRRGIRTIVLGGVATNAGVESTARSAHEHGYNVVLVEDVTSGRSAEMHQFSFTQIFPMLGRVTTSAEIRFK